jgi:predicted aconitase
LYLDPEEEKILNGEFGPTKQKMMEILVALGKVFSAERMVGIKSAQVSGASYKTIGEYGLEWLNSLDARVTVPTVLNPVGMDRKRWREMQISPDFASKQEEVIGAYARLGVRMECTCTPYYITQTNYGDHLAWSESSAVAYANSVIGARTNREGGPSALAAAIIGKTPEYGLHLTKERKPEIVIDVEGVPVDREIANYGAIGFHAGKAVGNRIPIFRGLRPTKDQQKALGAAMAASGAVALFHVEGITPEAKIFSFDLSDLETIHLDFGEISRTFTDLAVDAVALGCPHCSPSELKEIAALLKGKQVQIPLFIFAAGSVIDKNREIVEEIERSGARVYSDTCMVVSPAMEHFDAVMVNSGKAYAYMPNMCGAAARIGTTEECIDVATSKK